MTGSVTSAATVMQPVYVQEIIMSQNNQYDEHHNEGEKGYYRDLLMNEPGNPDHVRWIGEDKVVVEHVVEPDLIEINGKLEDIVF